MGRKRNFDADAAVRAARSVFWSNGYEGASLPDLEAATGLNRSSIYHAFGSKRGLFDAVVDSYLNEIIRPRLRVLIEDPVPPDAVRTYLNGLKAALLAQASSSAETGCLMVNTAVAPIAKDEAVRERIAAYRTEIAAALESGLTHQPDFDRSRVAPNAMAVTSLVVAAMTLAKVDSAAAAETIDAALAIVGGEASMSEDR